MIKFTPKDFISLIASYLKMKKKKERKKKKKKKKRRRRRRRRRNPKKQDFSVKILAAQYGHQ
jgi:hypothetical protein